MKQKIIGIIICTLMISSALVSATPKPSGTTSIISHDGTLSVTVPVGPYTVTPTPQGQELSLPDYGRLLVSGKPNLPSKIFSIAIPPGAQVSSVTFEASQAIILPGVYQIGPCPYPKTIGGTNPGLDDQQQKQYMANYLAVYSHNNPYPATIGEVIGTGGYRKYNLVDVRITPFSYLPVSGRLVYHPDITVHIAYTMPQGFTAKDIMTDNLPQTEQIANEIILNYDQAQPWYPENTRMSAEYDYVIITLDSLTSSIDDLVAWESAKGRNVNIVTTSWIDAYYTGWDLSAKIRAFLLEKYPVDEWGIRDVCIIGNPNDVPMRTTAQGPETDYYYAELSKPDSQSWDLDGDHQYGENSDPIDFEAEINTGRIPWSDPAIVQSICQKTVAYEQNNDDSFKKNILLLGAYFWPDTDNAVLMEAKVNQPWMTDWTMTREYEVPQTTYPCDYNLDYANCKSVWSNGTFAFVDWAGHGLPEAAYEYYPSQPFVDEATCLSLNDAYPAIVFGDSCSNSDTDYLNIGETMLQQGAIGFLGSNKIAYGQPGWNNPMSGSSQSLDYFFTTCCTSGNYTQGGALQWSLRQMYVNSLWTAGTYYETFEWGSIFGNPDLTMGLVSTSDPPATPSEPVGPTHGVRYTDYYYSTSTTDPNNDQLYYLFNWGDGTSSDWLGPYPSGQVTSASHQWSAIGNYSVKVKARDINAATSDWSEPLLVSIVLNDPPNTPTMTGPTQGAPDTTYLFKIQTTDPNGDDVFYYIDWGDNTTSGWIGPHASGVQATITHSWSQQGTWTIKFKAKDVLGDESDWGTMAIPIQQLLQFNQVAFSLLVFDGTQLLDT
jgi:hypothetical protein